LARMASGAVWVPRLRKTAVPGTRRVGGITGPALTLTGTLDGDVIGNGTTPENRQEAYANMAPGDKFLAVLSGADHFFFNNPSALAPRTGAAGTAVNLADNRAAVDEIGTAFWEAYLAHDPSAARSLHDAAAVTALISPSTFASR